MADEGDSGIRVEVRIGSPSDCPVAEISGEGEGDAPTFSVSKATSVDSPVVTEEVVIDSGRDVGFDSGAEGFENEEGMERVFSYGSKSVYRFSREKGRGCACERVEGFGFPVAETHTGDGDLFLTFHVPDTEALKEVVKVLKERYADAEVRRLMRSKEEGEDSSLVVVDRSELTKKQEEALRKAHEMGYFDHPKEANAGEVAEELGVSTSTFTEHLAAAQRKLMRSIVDG